MGPSIRIRLIIPDFSEADTPEKKDIHKKIEKNTNPLLKNRRKSEERKRNIFEPCACLVVFIRKNSTSYKIAIKIQFPVWTIKKRKSGNKKAGRNLPVKNIFMIFRYRQIRYR